MFKRTVQFLLYAGFLALPSHAAEDVVSLGKFKIYTDSVVAKLKEPKGDAGAQLQAMSIPPGEVKEIARTVPGLVKLKRPDVGALSALSDEQKAQKVVDWIKELKASGLFEYVEPNFQYKPTIAPNDARFTDGTLWGLNNYGQNGGVAGADVRATNAWDFTTGSTNVIVAVIDTGVRYTHRDLAAQMWVNPGEVPGNGLDDDNDGYVDNVYGIDPFGNDGDPRDESGHGTHVAGTIGAAANNGSPHVGVAWDVRIMALRTGDDDGFPLTAIVSCIDYATTHGAKIINASYGGYGYSQAQFDAIDAARSAGVLFVAAAGNDSIDNDIFPAFPASYDLDNIISVAATDRQDLIADFSNFGETSVDVGAPGVEIFSTHFLSDIDYAIFQGTSMATPHVVGVAALIAAYSPSATYSDIRDRILNGVDPVPSLEGRTVTGGRVNAFKAITFGTDGNLEVSFTPPPDSLITLRELTDYTVTITDGPPVTDATVTATVEGVTLNFVHLGTDPEDPSLHGKYRAVYQANTEGPLVFNFSITAPGKNPVNRTVTYQVVSRPPNDHFENATKLPTQGAVIGPVSTRLATLQPGEPTHAGLLTADASVWYSWSVPQAGPVLVDTAGSTYQTAIAVYTGNSLNNLTELASTVADLNRGKTNAWLKFQAVPGVSYKIAIASARRGEARDLRVRFELNGEPDTMPPIIDVTSHVSGITIYTNSVLIEGIAYDPEPNASGIPDGGVFVNVNDALLPSSANGTTNWSYPINDLQIGINQIRYWAFDNAQNKSLEKTLTIIYQPPPAVNDLLATAIPIGEGLPNGSETNSTLVATKEFLEPPHAGNEGGKSIWYRFSTNQPGVLLLDTRGSTFDTLLAVYRKIDPANPAPPFSNLQEVMSSDDVIGAGNFSEVTLGVEPGRIYWIVVDGFDAASGTAVLNHTFFEMQTFQLATSSANEAQGTVTPAGTNFYPVNATVSIQANPKAGFQFSHFILNDTETRTNNPTTVLMTGPLSVKAFFTVKRYSESFDENQLRLPFLFSTNISTNRWSIALDPANPENKVMMTQDTRDRETNSLFLRINTLQGLGSFDFGVNSETNYDRLEFYTSVIVDGKRSNRTLVGSWSGEIPRRTFTFGVTNGLVEFEWRYVKDGAITVGADRAFIDNLDLPLAPRLEIAPGGLVVVQEITQSKVVLEYSTDLQSWRDLTVLTPDSTGKASYQDKASSSLRFYRVRLP